MKPWNGRTIDLGIKFMCRKNKNVSLYTIFDKRIAPVRPEESSTSKTIKLRVLREFQIGASQSIVFHTLFGSQSEIELIMSIWNPA